jgi:uncharacterized damage-inducible protein DinB
MSNDPVIQAAQDAIAVSFADIRRSLEGVPPAALSWRPTAEETNSLSVLATHALGSTRQWLSVALDQPPPPRVRDREFLAAFPDAAAALRHAESVIADCEHLLATGQVADWSIARHTSGDPAEPTAAWALLHAVDHLREHVGQMMLTRQLWDAQSDDSA